MHCFILVTVEACASMDEDSRRILGSVTQPQHSIEGTIGAIRSLCHGGGGLNILVSVHAPTQLVDY